MFRKLIDRLLHCYTIRMKAAVLISSLVVLASVYTYTEACSCLRQHPQTKFCDADIGKFIFHFDFDFYANTTFF